MQFVQLSAIYREFSDPREQRRHEDENESHYHLLKIVISFKCPLQRKIEIPTKDRKYNLIMRLTFNKIE